ncbi:MAG: ABC transporter permease [Arenimonas sp.]
MSAITAIYRRELRSYFSTPLAAIFVVIFLTMISAFTFYLGNFFQNGQADLQAFFLFHPWMYLLLVPALGMRLWAEERKSGSIELLLTLPVTVWQAVLGKFLAAWTLIGFALSLTFPMWLTVAWLGDPDHGVIGASYIGSWLLGGSFLAIGSAISAGTRSQVMAFVITLSVCFVFLLAGYPIILSAMRELLSQSMVDTIAGLSFFTHFNAITRGILDMRDMAFFLINVLAWLVATVLIINLKRAG